MPMRLKSIIERFLYGMTEEDARRIFTRSEKPRPGRRRRTWVFLQIQRD